MSALSSSDQRARPSSTLQLLTDAASPVPPIAIERDVPCGQCPPEKSPLPFLPSGNRGGSAEFSTIQPLDGRQQFRATQASKLGGELIKIQCAVLDTCGSSTNQSREDGAPMVNPAAAPVYIVFGAGIPGVDFSPPASSGKGPVPFHQRPGEFCTRDCLPLQVISPKFSPEV